MERKNKILSLIILIPLLVFIIYSIVFIKIKINKIKTITKNKDNYITKTDKIKNKNIYKDELMQMDNITALKRAVKIYQWVEEKHFIKKENKYKYSYSLKWVNKPINSNDFKDKTKNNNCKNNNIYSNKEFIIEKIQTKNGYTLEKKYFIDKIKYKTLSFNNDSIFYGLSIKNKEYNKQTNNSYTDLDSYVSSTDNKVAIFEKDKFIAINNILFLGKNFYKPQVCDIKINYKIFKPTDISFFSYVVDNEITPYKNFNIINFSSKNINNLVLLKKFEMFLKLILIINLLIFFTNSVIKELHKSSWFTLKYIPFFNEYFAYTKNNKLNLFCIMSIFVFIIVGYYILIILPLFILFIARQFDYYSI